LCFCKGKHFNDQCNICPSLEDRENKIKEGRLCYRYLRPGQEARECPFKKACFYCHGAHNIALCKQKFTPKNQSSSDIKFNKISFDPSLKINRNITKNANQQSC